MPAVIHALMPSIHHRLTGGSIYNRRILEWLARSGERWDKVKLHVNADHSELPGGLWLVDSLCIAAGAAHLAKRADASGVLIAHYLEVLDSDRSHSARAAEESSMLHHYSGIVTTSRFARNALRDAGFQGVVEAIPPGLDEAYRRPTRRSTDPRGTAIVTVASVLPDKGLSEMLSALETLSDLNWSWEVIGDAGLDTDFAREFCTHAARSSVGDRIAFRGALPPHEVIAAYDRADIFALPSRFETCSMATMEAMARGLPVAAFRVGGLPDLLPEASLEVIAERGDLAGWRESLRRLIVSPAERHRLGEANRCAADRFQSWDDCGRAMQRFLERFPA
jgi:glycosyltransferase involved in cell wall biosynthesis